MKDVCEVRCELVGDDKVDDNLGRVYTVDVVTDECVDESDGVDIDGRMNDCLSNCCRDVSSYLVWLINRAVRARKVGQQQEAVGPQGSGGM